MDSELSNRFVRQPTSIYGREESIGEVYFVQQNDRSEALSQSLSSLVLLKQK